MKFLIKAIIFFSLTCVAFSQNRGNFETELLVEDVFTDVYYYFPENEDLQTELNLVIAFNGCGMEADQLRGIISDAQRENKPFILACPNVFPMQTEEQLMKTGRLVLDQAKNFHKFNINKVIISGFSYGGHYALWEGLTHTDIYDGIIGLAPATAKMMWNDDMWKGLRDIPVAVILGDEDFNFQLVDSLMIDINNMISQLLYLLKPGVEHHDFEYYASEEFSEDFDECYDFIIGTTAVKGSEFSDVKLYPNPATDYIEIKTDKIIDDIEVFDMLGIQIETPLSRGGMGCVLDVSQLQQGVYFVRVGSEFLKFVKI